MQTIIDTTGVPPGEWQPGVLSRFTEQLLDEIARALDGARPNSPLARAKQNLGDRFLTVLYATLREHLHEAIFANWTQTIASITKPEDKRALIDDIIVSVLGAVVHRANLKGRAA